MWRNMSAASESLPARDLPLRSSLDGGEHLRRGTRRRPPRHKAVVSADDEAVAGNMGVCDLTAVVDGDHQRRPHCDSAFVYRSMPDRRRAFTRIPYAHRVGRRQRSVVLTLWLTSSGRDPDRAVRADRDE